MHPPLYDHQPIYKDHHECMWLGCQGNYEDHLLISVLANDVSRMWKPHKMIGSPITNFQLIMSYNELRPTQYVIYIFEFDAVFINPEWENIIRTFLLWFSS